jgi:hypothetical protein
MFTAFQPANDILPTLNNIGFRSCAAVVAAPSDARLRGQSGPTSIGHAFHVRM